MPEKHQVHEKHHVVVDGSNLATEGRTLPNLAQLDEAVRSYADEDPGAEIVVVVDASFGHRIDPAERQALEEAELHGEIVSPPAGAIGRGDAFVLRIAERTGATVLSNDSFQEFHGEHPWLFDGGRLVGGKPVPGVGWIFTPRSPVRGAKSRQATGKSKRAEREEVTPAATKAAELAKAARKVAARRAAVHPDGSKPSIGDVWAPASKKTAKAPARAKAKTKSEKGSEAKRKATKATKKVAKKAAKAPAKKATKAIKATKKVAKKATKAPAKPAAKAPAKKAAKAPGKKAASAKKAAPAKRTTKKAAAKASATTKKAAVTKAAPAARATGPTAERPSSRRRPRVDPELAVAIGEATAEALHPPMADEEGAKAKDSKSTKKKGSKRRRRTSTPPPAVNEPLAFITFVANYPIGSEVEGEVASFTSHGAMIEVNLPDGGFLHCYIPLSGLGRPAPTKAREVLHRGERRTFELVSLDPPRRVAELALPGLAPPAG